jgi:hypothetical protein
LPRIAKTPHKRPAQRGARNMGNPNPSPETRFKPGQSGNPSGKSTEQALRDIATADMASRFRHALLSSVQDKIDSGVDPLELLNADLRAAIRDSEDRAHGTPKAVTEIGGTNTPIKLAIQRTIVDPQG